MNFALWLSRYDKKEMMHAALSDIYPLQVPLT